jgi:hypothetical protein
MFFASLVSKNILLFYSFIKNSLQSKILQQFSKELGYEIYNQKGENGM